jgi:cytochrome bd ubiquinol oxidase subunit II
MDLPLALGLVVAFGIAMYVVMDSFDLGVGILFPFAPAETDRDLMMNTIAAIWDSNETWLVLGGTLLIGAFPLAYGTLLPAFYVPIVLMLFALIFRGIAFEFRFRAGRYRHLWDWAFAGGSALTGFCQGIIIGAFINGIPVRAGAFVGGPSISSAPCPLWRARPRRRLCIAWCDLADLQNGQDDAGLWPADGATGIARQSWSACGHRSPMPVLRSAGSAGPI